MAAKQFAELFTVLEYHQTKCEEHQKQIDTKLDQIIVALESLTTKFDNLTHGVVKKVSHSEKDKFNHAPTVSQING